MLVSFIITAFNEEEFINDCIDSCLDQTYGNIEVCVVNDGSTDKTGLVLEKYKYDERVKLFEYKSNVGKIHGLNKAYEMSAGDYVFIIGADDINNLTRAECALKHFALKPSIVMICSNMELMDQKGNLTGNNVFRAQQFTVSDFTTQELIRNPKVWGPTICLPKSIAKSVFPLDARVVPEDWIIPVQASMIGDIVYLEDTLVRYRVHSGNHNGISGLSDYRKWKRLRVRQLDYFRLIYEICESKKWSYLSEQSLLNLRRIECKNFFDRIGFLIDLIFGKNKTNKLIHVKEVWIDLLPVLYFAYKYYVKPKFLCQLSDQR